MSLRLSMLLMTYGGAMHLLRLLSMCWLLHGFCAGADADRIRGTWASSDGKAHIEVTSSDGVTYVGTIRWLGSPKDDHGAPRLDDHNPDAALRTKPIIGLRILKDLSFEKGNAWSGGWIYDPESGKTYHCHATLSADGSSLDLRGYIGISLFGRTETWTRVPVPKP